MVRTAAIEIIARRLLLSSGRVSALAQRLAEAGEIPKGCGRSVPDLSPASLAKILLCAIADRGLGNAAASTAEFATLRTEGGPPLLDLLKGWASGAVPVSGVHSMILQLDPASVTVVTGAGHLRYGVPRDGSGAARVITIPGATIRAIVSELHGATSCQADAALAA